MKKSLSLALSCAIVFLSPGLGCWRALALGVDAGVRVEDSNMREPIAMPGMNFVPSDNNMSGDALGVDAIDTIGNTEFNAEQSRILPSLAKRERAELPTEMTLQSGLPLINSNAKPVATTQASPLAKGIPAHFHRASVALGKKINKIKQVVSNTVNGSQQLFDGLFLQPHYALAMPVGNAMQSRKPSTLRMNAMLDESASAGKDSNQSVTPPPAPTDNAALKAQIDQAIKLAQSVISLSDSKDAQEALTALEKDPRSMDSGNLGDLAMAPALSINYVKDDLIPLINKIAGQDLRAKDVQEKIAQLDAAGKSAAKGMMEFSRVITQMANVLDKASRTQEAAQWRDIVSSLKNQSAALKAALPAPAAVLIMRQDFSAYWEWARHDADATNKAMNIGVVAAVVALAVYLFTPSTAHAAGLLTGLGHTAAIGGLIGGGAIVGIVAAIVIALLIVKFSPSSIGPMGAIVIPTAVTLGAIVGALSGLLIAGFHSTAHAAGFLTGLGHTAAIGGLIGGGAIFGVLVALLIVFAIVKFSPSSIGPMGSLVVPTAITLGAIVGTLIGLLIAGFLF